MKKLLALFLFVGVATSVSAQTEGGWDRLKQGAADGIFQSMRNADLAISGEGLVVQRKHRNLPIEMTFAKCEALGVNREQDQWWVLPISSKTTEILANTYLWVLPVDAHSIDHSWDLELHDGEARATMTDAGLKVVVNTDRVTVHQAEARPHSDAFNHRFALTMAGGKDLEDALAGFYWGTMLPLVVEKTMAAHFPYSDGYVLSTLKVSSYAGSYPAVDHEFQIKGRLAMGSPADLDIVKRMIELQFRLMEDDPEHLSRAPTSVQPDGQREYHVRRNSKDNRQNAAMFPLTGNIEIMEEAWHYYEATKDAAWLQSNIGKLEDAATWIQASIDKYDRVWSDVYYEDQVIKDGRVTQAQAFTAYAFGLLSRMESLTGRKEREDYYASFSKRIATVLIEPLPLGYWDESSQRFIDWVDRNGGVHDHIHLLANTLPVTFGYATATQAEAVRRLVNENGAQFERFPSFLSADIGGYTPAEIGDGGPYDLSAAGRYWYWDAAFRESQGQNDLLLHQLQMVAAEGAKDNYFMGERYDMDYVYYIDGKNAHGAEQYYEYPNVFAAVLIAKLIGLTIPADADVEVAPHIPGYGSVVFDAPVYALSYSYGKDGFVLKNLSDQRRHFKVDLSALGAGNVHYHLAGNPAREVSDVRFDVDLPAHAEASWVPQR
jgi:hypothetical protein